MRLAAIAIVSCAVALAGCASVGPQSVVRDRFDYVSAISDSWKRQTLLNLLKVRYADAPVFMDVSSVISAYTVQADVGVASQATGGSGIGARANAGAQYGDRPTISYQPLTGDKFAKSLMAPIPVSGILYLIQSGFPADLVLRVCVNSVNGIENDYNGPLNPRAGDPVFRELMTTLRESQAGEAAGFRFKPTRDGQAVVMFLRPPSQPPTAPGRRMRDLLGLDSAGREFSIVAGSLPERDTEVAILTRSILQVMIDFAAFIDVPESDVAEGRVYTPRRSAEQLRMFPPLLAVRQGSTPPADAFTAVGYRDRWFWIDDRDLASKRALSLLMMMFSLTEGAPAQAAPVVTIPAR